MTAALLTAAFLAACVASFFFSGFETGFYTVNRLRLRSRSAHGERNARTLLRLERDAPGTLSAILIGNNLANFTITALGVLAAHAWGMGERAAEMFATVALGPCLFFLGELVPKSLGRAAAETLTYTAAPWMAAVRLALAPLAFPLGRLTQGIARLAGVPRAERPGAAGRATLDAVLLEGAGVGLLTPRQQEMARNVLRAEGRRVRDVMIPWERVATIPPDADARALRGGAPGRSHARYPVVSSDGHLSGIAHLLDLLRPGMPPAGRIARPAYLLRADQPVLAALLTLQRRRAPIAVVREAGRPVGIVTAKDLVEEIVGDLHDL